MIEEEIKRIVETHTAFGRADEWNVEEIIENATAINIATPELKTEVAAIQQDPERDEEKSTHMRELLMEKASVAFENKLRELGESAANVLRFFLLQTIDHLWMDHIEVMDYTRNSVRLRAYGQRDPLVEYKNEALRLFKQFNAGISQLVTLNIFKFGAASVPQRVREPAMVLSHPSVSGPALGNGSSTSSTQKVVQPSKYKEVGRNDPCPCGAVNEKTGEVYKFKKCGLINAPYHKG